MTSMNLDDIRADANNLFREEMITDLKIATIRKLTPIKADGTVDDKRDVQFIAQTQIMSQMGALPINAPLEATTLEDALKEFPQAVKQGVEKMVDEVRELQRQESGRIVVPRPGQGMGGAGLPGQPGAQPGGGQGPGPIVTG
jgi:hypothetical protein